MIVFMTIHKSCFVLSSTVITVAFRRSIYGVLFIPDTGAVGVCLGYFVFIMCTSTFIYTISVASIYLNSLRAAQNNFISKLKPVNMDCLLQLCGTG